VDLVSLFIWLLSLLKTGAVENLESSSHMLFIIEGFLRFPTIRIISLCPEREQTRSEGQFKLPIMSKFTFFGEKPMLNVE
jgi:hypothetical protein